jgi:outer membrane protein TolC
MLAFCVKARIAAWAGTLAGARDGATACGPVIAAGLTLLIGGCATYSRLPLPDKPDLATSASSPGLQPMDMNAVATLAVLNSPDLKAARAKANVSDAQAFAARLLPDPQLTASLDKPTDLGQGYIDAYGLGLVLDLQALLTHSAKKAAANAARDQARLDLLWQEWQTIAQARTLYVQQIIAADKQQFLAEAEESYTAQAGRSQRALEAGDTTLDLAGADLALLSDISIQLGTARRSALQTDQSLHALLGVAPQVTIPLQPLTAPQLPDQSAVDAAIARLPQTRPDLQALQAAYNSQEEVLRKAVLSQFPMISLGVNRQRDTSNVHSNGLTATLNLPLFDRGRGEIAVQRATRAQLRAEYQARLDQTSGDIWRLWAELRQLQSELGQVNERLPRLQSTVDAAHKAYEAGDFAATTYYTLYNAYLIARSAKSELTQSLWADSIALSAELGTQLPPVAGN